MKNVRNFTQQYIDWVIKLGRVKFSLLGFIIIAVLALFTHIFLSLIAIGQIHWQSLLYAIIFGLISAPFVIYFFTVLVERLELSRLDLEKSMQNKTVLLETISHELRTPLNGIVGLSQMLLDTDLTDEQRSYLKTISMSALSLGHIFNDIIDVEKIGGQRIELYLQETDFYRFINDINNVGKLMAEQKQLLFVLKCGQNLPSFLMLDSTRLNQILWNLLSNAVKFTEKGSISIEIERISANEYIFSVSDTGQGIPAQETDKIFAMYYQASQNKHKPAGSGIGLAVSKNIANLMGGDLTVQSTPGEGSTFTLKIKAEEVTTQSNKIGKALNLGLDVLLVEDIELNIVVEKSIFQKLGCTVDVAMTGKQAIEKFNKNHYDVVFLDIQLPDMTGFQIARYFRQKYEKGEYDYLPPLIALTANVMHSKTEYRRQGIDDVLRKPLSVKALTHSLKSYFGDEIALHTPETIESAVDFSLDFEILDELIEMLGAQFVQNNLQLFKQMMSQYLANLLTAYEQYQQDPAFAKEVASCAHKIKGAAASIGLKNICQIAKQAQDDKATDWSVKIGDWIKQLEEQWMTNVNELEQWLIGK